MAPWATYHRMPEVDQSFAAIELTIITATAHFCLIPHIYLGNTLTTWKLDSAVMPVKTMWKQ